jgi:outer membrane protein OmpA-like peptidoglycan-associated protein
MNSRIAVLVFLLAAFTLPTVAQQSTPASNDQSAASVPEQRERLTAPKATDFWDGDDPNFLNLVTHPFANKKYVQRYTGPIKDRLNELDEFRSEDANKVKDVDGRSQNGIQLASEKVNAAAQHANDAANKAQSAQSAATEASSRVSRVEQTVASLDHYTGNAQTEIHFRSGQTALSKNAKDALDQLAGPLKNQKNYIVEVRSFSAGHGSTAVTNSQRLADSVTRYLVLSHQIPIYRVRSVNMGNPSFDGTAKHLSGGRVEVNVVRNDQETTAQQ